MFVTPWHRNTLACDCRVSNEWNGPREKHGSQHSPKLINSREYRGKLSPMLATTRIERRENRKSIDSQSTLIDT